MAASTKAGVGEMLSLRDALAAKKSRGKTILAVPLWQV